MDDYILNINNLSKSFSNVLVLNKVSFSIKRGTIHGIIGENGAGKSTLIKILSGIYEEYDGEIFLDGKIFRPNSPIDAYKKGISTIFQELNVIPKQSVLENIFLGREYLRFKFILDKKKMLKKSIEALKELSADFGPYEIVENLSIANQQIIEICRALVFNANILIMDEPTSSLTCNETDSLFNVITKLKHHGKTIIYISHRLDEVFRICDFITILRDGKHISTVDAKKSNPKDVIKMMIGKDLESFYPTRKRIKTDKVVLSVKNFSKKGEFSNISFKLKEGEILGFGGLIGSGRTELAKSIIGINSHDSGELIVMDKKIQYYDNPKLALDDGIAYLSENRKDEGIFSLFPVRENICISVLNTLSNFSFIKFESMNKLADANIKKFKIKASSIYQTMCTLSGGNQQKAIIARLFETKSKIFIFDEPTRGIDVSSKYEIFNIMNNITYEGGSIIFITSEIPELINVADRIILMRNGMIIKELRKQNGRFYGESTKLTIEEEIMQLLTMGECLYK